MSYRPSDLRLFLDQLGKRPNKRLSQNFLIDGNIVRKIVAYADVKKGDTVVEIGPGPGALTEALLSAGATVIAIEKDSDFASALQRLQTPDGRLTVLEADALTYDITRPCKVVANLPYHITTPLLAKLLPLYPLLSSIVVMIQKEVAERFIGTKDYGSFTLFLQFYARVEYGFTVEPTCFYPRPKVKSAVVKLLPKEPPPVSSVPRFFRMTRTAFQKRRKMLRASLKELYPVPLIESALQTLGKDPLIRPEALSLDDFLRFFEIVEQGSAHIQPQDQ